ncbi:MAG: alpha/beta hydrolase, partial [Actinomycetota bacterium]|nr:alpha/beta hydrolase [Actinomycetota bacterium]
MMNRRTFAKAVGLAATSTAALAATGERAAARPVHPGRASTSFADVLQIDAGELNVGYVDLGPRDGQPVILLHGWPYDIHSYAEVAPILAKQGY